MIEVARKIKELKGYLLLSFLVFVLFFMGGILFVKFYPSLAQSSFRELQEAFSPVLELGPFSLGAFIFFNNSIKIFLFIFLGLLFAIPTLFFLAMNGWVLGYAATLHYQEFGLETVFHALFYHGIFEVAALLLGASLGLHLGVLSFRMIRREVKEKKKNLREVLCSPVMKEELHTILKVFLYIILPLLFIAALIETLLIFFAS